MNVIDYHAHIYYDENSLKLAHELIKNISKAFDVELGRMHEKLVGPHPRWSCQIHFKKDQFSTMTEWLMLNRNGLTVFLHPNTGNGLLDHRDHALWMGEILPLNLSIFD